MTDFLVVIPTNGKLAVEIRRDEPAGSPWKWAEYERAHPGAWCRLVQDEELTMGFEAVWQRARDEHEKRQPKSSPQPAAPQLRGVRITPPALKQMLWWSLTCLKIIATDQDFDLIIGPGGLFVIPGKIMEKRT